MMGSEPIPPIELEFRTDDEREREFCRRYWATDDAGKFIHAAAAIAAELGVASSRAGTIIGAWCIASLAEESCPKCGRRQSLKSRAEYDARHRNRRWSRPHFDVCQQCHQAQQLEIKQRAEQQAQRRVQVLQADLDRLRAPENFISPNVIDFKDAIYLVSMFRSGAAADMSYIVPQENYTHRLSPSEVMDRQIIEYLYSAQAIVVHPRCYAEAVVFEGDKYTAYRPFKAPFIMPLPEDGPSPARYIEELEKRIADQDRWDEYWFEDAKQLQRDVALEECLEYLRVALDDHGFDLPNGDKVTNAVRLGLTHFSIAQMYNFIWRTAKDMSAFYLREHASRPHVSNVVPGHLQRMIEKARADNWDVKQYRRDRRVPESQLSHVLFTVALQLPDGGLNAVPPAPVDHPA